MEPTIRLLRTLPLLGGLSERELRQIYGFFTTILLNPEQTLYAEGSPADSACFVVEGELDAFTKLPGGGEAQVGTITPGAMIGEMALLKGGPRTATVRARTNAMVISVSAAFFQAALGQKNLPAYKILRRVIHCLTERLGDVQDKIVHQMEKRTCEGVVEPPTADPPVSLGQGASAFDYRLFLPKLPFFRNFDGTEVERLLALGEIVERPRRFQLAEEGSRAEFAYLVIRGSVECTIRRRNMQLSVIGPGRIIGANDLIGGWRRRCGARTRSASLLLQLDETAFGRLFNGETAECLKFQNEIGVNQLGELQSANNLLALLVNLAHIRARSQLASVS